MIELSFVSGLTTSQIIGGIAWVFGEVENGRMLGLVVVHSGFNRIDRVRLNMVAVNLKAFFIAFDLQQLRH